MLGSVACKGIDLAITKLEGIFLAPAPRGSDFRASVACRSQEDIEPESRPKQKPGGAYLEREIANLEIVVSKAAVLR